MAAEKSDDQKRDAGSGRPLGGASRDLIAPGGKVDADRVRALANQMDREGFETGDDEDGALTVTFKLSRDLKKRLDKYLQDRIGFMSRTQLQRLIKEEAVTVNGRVPKASTTLRIGDEVRVMVPPPPTSEIPAEDIPLTVLYEDDDLIVINKADDIIVHPARGNKAGTIINALAFHFKNRSGGSLSNVGREDVRPGVVHRLDRHTTGALIAAKTDTAHWRLGKQFAERTTDKRYLAMVVGRVEPVLDTIDLPIGKHSKHRERMAVQYGANAKSAITNYRVREQFDGFALVELELKTGRTHQIRVHLSHLGWPIVGDDMYGGPLLNMRDVVGGDGDIDDEDEPLMHRQALHAWSIAFRHPISNERMEFKAPIPADFRRLLAVLREYRSRMTGTITPPGATVDLEEVENLVSE